jgi:hypothetical protein
MVVYSSGTQRTFVAEHSGGTVPVTGGFVGGGVTPAAAMVTAIVFAAVRVPSLTAKLIVYVPAVVKVAPVEAEFAEAKVTEDGPPTSDHVYESVFEGRPSSVAEPERVTATVPPLESVPDAVDARVTTGAWFVADGGGVLMLASFQHSKSTS